MREFLNLVQEEISYQVHKPGRVLFDHLPKCAGTTINRYLLTHYPKRHVFQTDGRRPFDSIKKFQSLPQIQRHRYRLIIGHLTNALLEYIHSSTLTATVFRDPVDRIVSHYFYVKQEKQHYLHDRVMKLNIALDDYASSGLSVELRNWYTTHFTGLSIEAAEAEPDEAVKRAVDTILKSYRIIGFQDDLPGFVQKLRRAADLYRPFEDQVQNKTIERVDIHEIPEKTRRAIAETNSLDVKLYIQLRESVEGLARERV